MMMVVTGLLSLLNPLAIFRYSKSAAHGKIWGGRRASTRPAVDCDAWRHMMKPRTFLGLILVLVAAAGAFKWPGAQAPGFQRTLLQRGDLSVGGHFFTS